MNIYIAGLSYSMNDADLKNLFSEFGEVSSAKVIMDNYTQKSRGFGFVEMPTVAEGQDAIEKLNGAEVEGKTLIVNVAKERSERPSGGRSGGYSGGSGGYRSGGNSRSGGGYDRDSRNTRRY